MRAIVIVLGCLVLSACTRVDIPQFTSIECNADPAGPPVTDPKKIEEVARIFQTLPGRWKVAPRGPAKPGIAVVLMRDSRPVAQVVIGDDWVSISQGPNSPEYEKSITHADGDRLVRLSRQGPNQSVETARGTLR